MSLTLYPKYFFFLVFVWFYVVIGKVLIFLKDCSLVEDTMTKLRKFIFNFNYLQGQKYEVVF